ncbi:MAG: hypothetical protein NTX61_12205 [Bacteroidetes bacterium]|nr:hypothetical protein [Bacteroidota bacterium]
MIIYRFRITSEDQEDFLREIDIQPVQTFLDFHEIMQSTTDLDPCENAFFYTTDRKYKKHQEISLKPHKKRLRKYDQELDEIVTEEFELHLMKDSRLKNFIEDPHQKMIYEYYTKDLYVFHLELFKLLKEDDYIIFPKCIKKTGEIQKKIFIPVEPVAEEEIPLIPPVIFDIPREKEIILSGIEENEAEIAEIEDHIDELLVEEDPLTKQKSISVHDETDEYFPEDENIVESMGDFEDLENIEMNQHEYDSEPDDY